jgi:aspartyl protease family protein
MHRWFLITCLLLGAAGLHAAPSVRVLALFPGKAMLEIDGERRVLAAGAEDRSGVRLVDADTDEAVVEIDGRRETLRLGSAVAASYSAPVVREIRIVRDSDRRGYFIDGLINGRAVQFLVDTGATSIAMSERQATRLGILHRVDGRPVSVGTASGRAMGHQVDLREVSVGGLRLTDVRAVVIDGDSPAHVLLGMNVLSEFDLEQRANLLILRSRP